MMSSPSMVSPLFLLPMEVLHNINQYLTVQDRHELCLVNRTLYWFFKDFLFSTIQLHTTEQVIDIFHRLTYEPHLFWKIRKMDVDILFPEMDPFSNALAYCQNLASLKLGAHYWDAENAHITVPSFDNYPVIDTLVQLEIDCDAMLGIEDFDDLFERCPGLERLKLRHLIRMTFPKDMEKLHGTCPRLQEVLFDHIGSNQNPFGTEREQVSPTTTCESMHKIVLHHDGLWDDFSHWLHYIPFKYPNLQALEIIFQPTWVQGFHVHDVVGLYRLKTAVQFFVEHMHHLQAVHFVNVFWADTFFRHRFRQQGLKRSTFEPLQYVTLDYMNGIRQNTLGLVTISDLANIKSLDLTVHHAIMDNPVHLFRSFRFGRHLTELRLSCPKSCINNVSLHWFLESCLGLKTLTLDSASVDILNRRTGEAPFTISSHGLSQITLTRCIFTNDIWVYLEKRCPDLHQLHLTISILHGSASLQLAFPRHVFKCIAINHVRVARPPPEETSVPSPMASTHIDDINTWLGAMSCIEFISIEQQHTTGSQPSNVLGPRLIVNHSIRQTRISIKRLQQSGGPYVRKLQIFHATGMKYVDSDFDDRGYISARSFSPMEYLLTVKCLSQYEADYYRQRCLVPLPSMTSDDNHYSPSASQSKRQRRHGEEADRSHFYRERLPAQLRPYHAPPSSYTHHDSVQRGGHLFIGVYGVTELMINEKWLIT